MPLRIFATIFLHGEKICFAIGIILIILALHPDTSYLDNGFFFIYAIFLFAIGVGIWSAKRH